MYLPRDHQHGGVLIVALVILLAMSLLGVASLRSGIFHERMSLNSQAEVLTFMGAESAINGILSHALQVGQGGADPAFFADVVLGAANVSCVTRNGIIDGACATVSQTLDTRNSGVLFALAETVYENSEKVFNSDAEIIVYHKFKTTGSGYLRANLGLPFATRNLQGWKKLGVSDPFTMSGQDLMEAAGRTAE